MKKEETVIKEKTKDKYYWFRHPILGYAPQKNKKVTFDINKGSKFLRSITYTIDNNGLRVSPPYKKGASECILFFVDSFTFGEKVSDEETLPYRVGIETDGRYQVYNFGYHGYGPHQMLSAIEQGVVQEIIKCTPKYVIYQALPDHVKRSAGLVPWDRHGPRYVLNKDGEVVFKGHFDEGKIVLPERLRNQLLKSLIIKKIWLKYFAIKRRAVDENDIELFLAIVDKSRDIFESRYSGCEFHVIFWDYKSKEFNNFNLIEKLKERKLRTHLVNDILPDFDKNPSIYQLSELGDTHPNPLAYKIIAKYITKEIIDK